MKWSFIFFLLSLTVSAAGAQSLNLNDLIKLTSLSHDQAKSYLTKERKFSALLIIDTVGAKISQFTKAENPGITELIIKSAWRDDRGLEHQTVHYDVRPKAYAAIILHQLKLADFRLVSHDSDKHKTVFLYENERFTVSVSTFSERKLPASIEVHVK